MYLIFFFINSLYHLVLGVSKTYIMAKQKELQKFRTEIRKEEEKIHLKTCGLLLSSLGITFFFSSLRQLMTKDFIMYPDYILYIFTAISLYKTFTACLDFFRVKENDSLLFIVRVINMAEAIVSIGVARTILQTYQNASFSIESGAIFGIICSVILIGFGIILFLKNYHYHDKK